MSTEDTPRTPRYGWHEGKAMHAGKREDCTVCEREAAAVPLEPGEKQHLLARGWVTLEGDGSGTALPPVEAAPPEPPRPSPATLTPDDLDPDLPGYRHVFGGTASES